MYQVTYDYHEFYTFDARDQAIEFADCIRGIVFLVYNGENLVIYSHNDI